MSKVTVQYGRKIKPDTATYEYEGEEITVTISAEKNEEGEWVDDPAELESKAVELLNKAKLTALLELGLPTVIGDDGTVRESKRVEAAAIVQFPGAQVQQGPAPAPQQQHTAPPPTQAAPAQSAPVPPASGPAPACPKCGSGMFDDRAKNAWRRANGYRLGHDLKCKNSGCTNERGQRTVIWPDDYQQYKGNPPEPRG